MHEILAIGDVCNDENSIEGKLYFRRGGSPTIMQIFFDQHPDCHFMVATRHGTDFDIQGLSVYPPEPDGDVTLRFRNIVTGGKRQQECFSSEQARPVPFDGPLIGLTQSADTIYFTPLVPNISADYVRHISRVRKIGSKTVLLAQGYLRKINPDGSVGVREFEEALHILPYIDVVIVSEEDLGNKILIGQDWSSKFEKLIVVVTQAQRGATIIQNGTVTEVPTTTPVPLKDIVNSIGAGDMFAAALMYKLYLNDTIKDAVDYANTVAGQYIRCQPDEIHFQ